jgi:hypothetical protein
MISPCALVRSTGTLALRSEFVSATALLPKGSLVEKHRRYQSAVGVEGTRDLRTHRHFAATSLGLGVGLIDDNVPINASVVIFAPSHAPAAWIGAAGADIVA